MNRFRALLEHENPGKNCCGPIIPLTECNDDIKGHLSNPALLLNLAEYEGVSEGLLIAFRFCKLFYGNSDIGSSQEIPM